MKTVAGVADVLLGLMFFSIAGLVLTGVPGAARRYGEEPEDLTILGILFLLSMFLAATVSLAGVILLRERGFRWISAGRATWLLTASVVILLASAVIGFSSNDPSSGELRLLPIPAAVLAWSSYVMRKAFPRSTARA